MLRKFCLLFLLSILLAPGAGAKSLHELQQEFVDLKFGLFVHFGMGTFQGEDWADPEVPVSAFNPT